ncbi:MAG: DUF87 domain-containing protein [Bacilli bacterium]|nr:DUF87 domain-containing protein [Bacilli bacterium]
MFGKIMYISDNIAHVANLGSSNASADLMNVNVIFEANDQRILGEITEVNPEYYKIRFLGEYINNKYVNGVLRKPLLSSKIRIINNEELMEIVGRLSAKSFILGKSAIYKNFTVCPNINDIFSNHFAIFGNTGSGKSCGVARLIQNLFANPHLTSYNANIFIFDAYGEYKNAFKTINNINPNYSYKFVTTNPVDNDDFLLQIPVNLLNNDDFALLLQASTHSQLPIIERTLRLAKIFSQKDETAKKFKNHLIAKALLAVLFSNQTTASKKNQIFTIIEVCHTEDFNFDTQINGLGYSRTFSECFEIDSNGHFGESVLITEYILKNIEDRYEECEEPETYSFSLKDFAQALEFTLISEGFQNNSNLYDDAIILKVRINSIINSKVGSYFVDNGYTSLDKFVSQLVTKNGKKSQIININLEDIDDVYAKVMVKVMARILYEFTKTREQRASIPFHLLLEEAHRYIQKDSDTFLIGYNIFERIAKEGRKYGTVLGIISQRPVELSDTVISQCSNFLIFKMTHPKDIKYIEEMLPNISADVIEKQKTLQPGTCVGFGGGFKIPMIIKLEMPNPTPYSSNADVSSCWALKQSFEQPSIIKEPQGASFNSTNVPPINNAENISNATINIMPDIESDAIN